jgi:REP element-mobilizing transposase RayT
MDYNVFDNISYAAIAADILRRLESIYNFNLYGFVIMPNHIHILLRTTTNGNSFSNIIQKFKSLVYHEFNKKHGVLDKFWQKSFYATIKNSLEECQTTLTYMKNNPIKWELLEIYSHYPYQYFNKQKIKELPDLF